MHPTRSRPRLAFSPIQSLLVFSLLVVAVTLVMSLTPLAKVRATAIVVDTLDDELNDGGDDCSLREAIEAANTDSAVDGCSAGDGDDAILLPAGRYVLALSGADEDANGTGDLDVLNGNVILMGTGPERTIIDGSHLDRVLHIHGGSAVEIHGIQITNGKTPDGYPGGVRIWGGGIRNDGTLLLSHSTVVSNATGEGREADVDGGHGGGIYSSGVMTLDHTSVVDNVAGNGGGSDFFGGYGGNGGSGGGIYSVGSMTSLSSIFSGNRAGDGGRGGEAGDGGAGGGIYNGGTLNLTDSTIDGNAAGHGTDGWWLGGTGGPGGGIYSSSILTVSNSTIMGNVCGRGGGAPAGYGVFGGDGGGIYSDGVAVVTNTVVLNNLAGLGGGGDYGSGGGKGGGIYNGDTLTLSNSSIAGNATGDGAYSHFGPYFNYGGAGGGIYNAGTLEVSSSTISGNTTGDGGEDPYDEGSDGGHGGGIYNAGTLGLSSSTVSGNTTGDGSEGDRGNSGYGGGVCNRATLELANSTIYGNATGRIEIDGIGGGIYTDGTLLLGNTILAENIDISGPSDCYLGGGSFQSLGYNLEGAAGSCPLTVVGDVTGTDPLLGSLGDHGGATFTHPLLPNSPAIDRGSCEGSPSDQRGMLRPVDLAGIANADDGCDIGAFEVQQLLAIYLPLITR